VHELVGHAATFASPEFVALNRAFGRAADHAREEDARRRIDRLYWFTMEFGVVEEAAGPERSGRIALLLRELGRFGRRRGPRPLRRRRDRGDALRPDQLQARLFVAPSFERLALDVIARLEKP